METGVEAKARLIREAAMRGEFGLKLCERHYCAHVEGSGVCIIRTEEEFLDFLDELPDKIDQELDILESSFEQLKAKLATPKDTE